MAVGGPDCVRGDWSGLVVYVAGTAWDGIRGSDRHLAERLVDYAPVLYVDPPLSATRGARRGPGALRPRLERLGDRLLRLTPVVPPGHSRRGMRTLTHAIARRTIRAGVDRLGVTPDVVVVASLNPVLDAVPARLRVLYGTDDFVAGADLMGIARDWARRLEQRQLQSADLVVAVTDVLAERWSSQARRIVVIGNGCDERHFATSDGTPLPAEVTLAPPVAGFVGHLSDRIDLGMLEAVADEGYSLLLVGPRLVTFTAKRAQALLDRPNVQWIGPRPFAELPRYVRIMDVGLVPYVDSPFNRASSPLKTLEYLAAGRPAVVSDLPVMHTLPDGVVTVASDPASFLAGVRAAMGAPPDPAAAHRRRAVASGHSWDVQARRFAEALQLVTVDMGSS